MLNFINIIFLKLSCSFFTKIILIKSIDCKTNNRAKVARNRIQINARLVFTRNKQLDVERSIKALII